MDTQNDATAEELDFRKKHTVCDAMFWDYLQGKLDPAEALLVATHYNLSPEARKRVNELNACAAVGLETLEPVAMKCSAEEFFKKCCHKPAPKTEECADKADIPVPKPLQSYLGKCFKAVSWQEVMPGLREKRLKICRSAYKTKVVKVDKGVAIPAHGHTGDEITLVLYGLMKDGDETYKTGEVSFHKADSKTVHAPQAVEECICLVALSGSSRVPGILGLIINPILRLRGL